MHLKGTIQKIMLNQWEQKKGGKPHENKRKKNYSEKSFVNETTKANDESDCGMSLKGSVSSL